MSLFVRRPPSAHPSDHKKLLLTLFLSNVWPGANTVGSILYNVYTLGQNALGQNCIGPRSDVGCRTRAMSGEVFYGRTVRRSEGSRMAKGIVGRQTADGRKFLLLFKTARITNTNVSFNSIKLLDCSTEGGFSVNKLILKSLTCKLGFSVKNGYSKHVLVRQNCIPKV